MIHLPRICSWNIKRGCLLPYRFYIYPPGYVLRDTSMSNLHPHRCMYKYTPRWVYVDPTWYQVVNMTTNRNNSKTTICNTQVNMQVYVQLWSNLHRFNDNPPGYSNISDLCRYTIVPHSFKVHEPSWVHDIPTWV